jgi:hypothetical protein
MERHISRKLALSIAAAVLLLVSVIAIRPSSSVSDRPIAQTPDKRSAGSAAGVSVLRSAKGPIRILPLGDSITQADANHLGYRYRLWVKLVDAGIDFDFVGSLRSNHLGNPQWPLHKDRLFDRDHEGHWGWRADEILGGPAEQEKNSLSEWLKGYTPDIVLMHLGSNDVLQYQDVAGTAKELRQIIKALRADNPHVIILLAKLIPTRAPPINARIEELNAQIAKIPASMGTAESPVIIVDQYSGFRAEDIDASDWIHPTRSGEDKMAAKWFEAIQGCKRKPGNTNAAN